MRTAQDIILKPIITEESMMGIMTKKYLSLIHISEPTRH